MFAVIVTFRIEPGRMNDFLPLMRANAATSLRTEAGCHQFDVATDPARPDEVFLYELYSDAAAFQTHLKSQHFLAFAGETDAMVADKAVKTYESVQQ